MTAQYHDALDRYEARMRAEQADRELDDVLAYEILQEQAERERDLDEQDKRQCCCFEFAGDNDICPIHGAAIIEEPEGSDTSATAQLSEAGFGEGGVL
jgi:hypothetical protein